QGPEPCRAKASRVAGLDVHDAPGDDASEDAATARPWRAALLQGARGATEDIDLWFESVTDPRLVEAAGGIWVSGSFGMGPPRIGGEDLSDRLDVVVHMSGLERFDAEYGSARHEEVDSIRLPVLPLERILHSKRAAGRPKDLAAIHAIEDALAVLAASGGSGSHS
ncbi:MAG TPA: hypothetical protein RMF84_02200, partial [Polyangiaceae bacterium LLY-WYZ-14_1]|nr:hypothetical protein [Polyangiaceae bacterium LLY-WYZ-14_1]